MLLFLIGYMGCGKTTIGHELAKKLNYRFYDLDDEIERIEEKSVAAIFSEKGELVFRQKEKEVLQKMMEMEDAVIASGGGTPCHFDNMELLNKNGTTIYLQTAAGVLFSRLIREKEKRPLISKLSDIDLMDHIIETLKTREKFYLQSRHVIKTEKEKVEDLVKKVLNEVRAN